MIKEFSLQLIPYERVESVVQLETMYMEAGSNPKADGLQFIHAESAYTPGITPYVLRWRDFLTSNYPLETDMQGNVIDTFFCCLRVEEDNGLATEDERVVARLGDCFRTELEKEEGMEVEQTILKIGSTVKVAICGVNEGKGDYPLEIEQTSVKAAFKPFADSWTAIAFRYQLRLHQKNIVSGTMFQKLREAVLAL